MDTESIRNIRIADYDYPLPDERIARHPLADRDSCLLMVADAARGFRDMHFRDLPDLLPDGSLLVRNDTRVINARIKMRKATGAVIEIFLLEPIEPVDYNLMFQAKGKCRWNCLVGNLKRWKEGELSKEITVGGRTVTLSARRLEATGGNGHDVEFTIDVPDVSFGEVLESAGFIPIPPYLGRESEQSDADDYQTVYANIQGSVAAPTAGLHFTPELFNKLEKKGIVLGEVTLHVGAGTFQPVKSDTIGDHPMHTETFSVTRSLLEKIRAAVAAGRKITAVGTTTVRTLESLAYLAAHPDRLHVGQWEAYTTIPPTALESVEILSGLMDKEGTDSLTASTAIMIAPGFEWRIVDILITNFHQPQSTLLLLVDSYLKRRGIDWRDIYHKALGGNYRFLSYGDACLFM